MKKRKTLIISITTLFVILISYYFFSNSGNDILTQRKFTNYLFNSSNISIRKNCYNDLIGLSTDGAVYDFYEYNVEGLSEVNIVDGYPKFDSIFVKKDLVNIDFCYWRKTPLINDSSFYYDIANSANITKYKCSSDFQKNNYLKQQGNYYCFVSAYPIGTYLLVYTPKSKKLFVIFKK